MFHKGINNIPTVEFQQEVKIMELSMDKKLTLEEMGLFSIMNDLGTIGVTAENLTKITDLSFKKVLRLLKGLIDKGFVMCSGDKFIIVPEKADEYIII